MTAKTDTYPRTAFLLIGLAVVIMVVVLVTDRGDLTSATLVLVAFASFVTGLFIFSFRREERISEGLAAQLAVPYTTTFSRILADLGVEGPAHFIPMPEDGGFPAGVMQFNPVGASLPERFSDDQTFYTGEDAQGMLTVPSGIPLLALMEQDHALTVPASEPELLEAIREVNQDYLEIARKVQVTHSGASVVVALQDFRLIANCARIRDNSPRDCITAPCPICSLAAIMLAQGLRQPSVMQQVLVDQKVGTLEVHIGVKRWEEEMDRHPLSYWGGSDRLAKLIGSLKE
jgi:hypothetical protein